MISSAVMRCCPFPYSKSRNICSTTVHLKQGPIPPNPSERLKSLKSAEKTVAVFAGVSLLLGYFALKRSFKDMASKKDSLPRPLVIAGPSGSGKSTLLKKLLSEYPDNFGFSISHTSRKPRPGEKNGREYHFCSKEDFQYKINSGDFIEWAEYSSNLYGTSKKSVNDIRLQNKVCVLDIDMQGVRSVKGTDLNPVYLFIKPPSLQILKERLTKRGTESDKSLASRLKVAEEEMDYASGAGVFDHSIVNDSFDAAYEELKQFISKELCVLQQRDK